MVQNFVQSSREVKMKSAINSPQGLGQGLNGRKWTLIKTFCGIQNHSEYPNDKSVYFIKKRIFSQCYVCVYFILCNWVALKKIGFLLSPGSMLKISSDIRKLTRIHF